MKTKILSILALLLMTVTQGAWADELTVYDGAALCPYSPAYINYFDWYTRSQYIIPAANLEAMNGKVITALKYYSNTSNKTSTCNVDVYLKEVSYTTFNSTPTFETKSGIVYRGTVSIAGDGTLTITFTTPYTYNGGNLLIGMENTETDNLDLKYTSFYCQYVNGAVAFGTNSSSLAAVTATRGEFIPKTTFTYETPVPGTPVDLGLPSGKKWADRNVGALNETGYGTYYAWSSSDIATAQWGNDWRMPTLTEAQELIDNTDQEWATIGDVKGTKFMKKTNHSVYIFVPAAGWDGSGNGNIGTAGAYWTSTAMDGSRAYEFAIRASGNATGYDNMTTHQFTIRPVQMFAGEGTQASPYLIASTTDWNNLVSAVNGGETYSGNYFKMTANVGTVSTWMTGTFSGTFDGDGKTLTVGYTASGDYTAPFGYMSGATVENLKVAGTISSSSGYRQASIGGRVANSTIRNCTSSVAFTLSQGDWVECGGLVAHLVENTTLTMTGCAFTGSITYSNATGYAGGGLIGWFYNGCTVTLTDCVFAPSSVSFAKESDLHFYMFADIPSGDHTLKLNNCYYNGTAACNDKITKQDGTMQMHTIAKGDGVSSLSVTKGSATETYDVSGIKVYSGGIDFNDGSTTTFYGGSGQTVSLALTHETPSGYQFKQYAASQGTLSGQTTNAPTLTMPAANSTANDAVTISAEYDPTYNATFADASDASNGWSISPTSGIVGSTVTVSYSGENKVKSVTVTKLALCSLSEVTNEHVGKIIGADGNVYASLAQAEKVTSAVGVLGKVTETGHGLILALQDATSQSWNTINGWTSETTYAGTTLKVLPDDAARGSNLPSYTTLGSTTVSNWAVATRADYTAIFTNLGSTGGDSDGISYDANMNAKITGAGGTAISGENWSSTQHDSTQAWRFASTWGGRNKTDQYKVRPVLGF